MVLNISNPSSRTWKCFLELDNNPSCYCLPDVHSGPMCFLHHLWGTGWNLHQGSLLEFRSYHRRSAPISLYSQHHHCYCNCDRYCQLTPKEGFLGAGSNLRKERFLRGGERRCAWGVKDWKEFLWWVADRGGELVLNSSNRLTKLQGSEWIKPEKPPGWLLLKL